MRQMGIPSPDIEPRVTEYLKKIESFISTLQSNGRAYVSDDGIYFDTQIDKVDIYPLSKKISNDLISPSTPLHAKRHHSDFALWKLDDSFGFNSSIFNRKGRPGWHMECSAMHHHTLGTKFDIHGGGRDLIFPHHENEISQSVAHNGVNPANYWIHNGMMTRDGQKLSKSLGNSIYVKDLLKTYTPEGIKIFLNKGGYGQSQEFNISELIESNDRWLSFATHAHQFTLDVPFQSIMPDVLQALSDDLNTPLVVVLLYRAIKNVLISKSKSQAEEILSVFKLLSVLPANATLQHIAEKTHQQIPTEVINIAAERQVLKNNQEWPAADEKRLLLQKLGWIVQDHKSGDYTIIKIIA